MVFPFFYLVFSIFHYFPMQHMSRLQPDLVKRWINEVQEAANSDSIMVQVKFIRLYLFHNIVYMLYSTRLNLLSLAAFYKYLFQFV